jgi:LmbE family N-acetylglucosaminyl deacetylase
VLRIAAPPSARRRLYRRLRDETAARCRAPAVVFAPHPDDETLGCGGTMILKRDAGTFVGCVFMTDGATSHQAFMDGAELCRLRKAEAVQATGTLGLDLGSVSFLDFPDGRLARCHADAVERVTSLLKQHAPEEVYVPYRRDGTSDHEATYRIVVEALRRTGHRTRLLEYPVWFWNRWPWVSLRLRASRTTLTEARVAAAAGFGVEMCGRFDTGVFVGPVLERKRAALEHHRSQMTVLVPGTLWPTLDGVSDGEFLACFFQPFEVFHVSEFSG